MHVCALRQIPDLLQVGSELSFHMCVVISCNLHFRFFLFLIDYFVLKNRVIDKKIAIKDPSREEQRYY